MITKFPNGTNLPNQHPLFNRWMIPLCHGCTVVHSQVLYKHWPASFLVGKISCTNFNFFITFSALLIYKSIQNTTETEERSWRRGRWTLRCVNWGTLANTGNSLVEINDFQVYHIYHPIFFFKALFVCPKILLLLILYYLYI